jgi:hypothetical protein
MYINKIDELLDIVIDDFYNVNILDNKFDVMLKEKNFVKYQLDINKIIILINMKLIVL